MTNFMLQMHQKLVLRHAQPAPAFSGLNVRSCRPASRSTSTRRRHAFLERAVHGASRFEFQDAQEQFRTRPPPDVEAA